MAGLDDAYESGGATIAATGHRQAADAAWWHAALLDVVTLRDLRHGTGGLAGRQNDQPSGRGCRQMRPQAALGVRGGHCRAEQPLEKKPSRFHRGSSSRAARAAKFDLSSAARLLHRDSREIAHTWRHKHRAVIGCNPRWKAARCVTILRVEASRPRRLLPNERTQRWRLMIKPAPSSRQPHFGGSWSICARALTCRTSL